MQLRKYAVRVWICVLLAAGASAVRAENAANDDALVRLVATLDSEPLAVIACRDARALPDKFSATTLAKMIADPAYVQGEAALENKFSEWLGVDPRKIWPTIARSISGPMALALLPAKAGAADGKDAPMRLVFVIAVPMADVGEALKQQLPNPNGGALGAAEIKTVAPEELPAVNKMPAWAANADWPKSDLLVWAQPKKLCDAARPLIAQQKPAVAKLSADSSALIKTIEGSGIDALAWGVSFNGEAVGERLVVKVAEENSEFKTLAGAVREKPAGWEALMGATAGDVDAAVLIQSDLNAMGDDKPHAFQALERYLRGRTWTRMFGGKPDALAPSRFSFLSERMLGSYSITARAAITGEIRLIVTSSIKSGDIEEFRGDLVKGLENAGGVFDTLKGARKIGGTLPLGAAFRGRGQFASPVIGLSTGWAWLCSSSIAYQELTDAFKTGKTLAAREKKRTTAAAKAANGTEPPAANGADAEAQPNSPAQNDDWSAEDAIRAEVNLDRVVKIGYAAWMLANGNDPPMFGGEKIPAELLPSPKVFERNLGHLRGSINRSGARLECRATSTIPGMTLGLLTLLQDAAESMAESRKIAADAQNKPETAPDAPARKNGEKTGPGNGGAPPNAGGTPAPRDGAAAPRTSNVPPNELK